MRCGVDNFVLLVVAGIAAFWGIVAIGVTVSNVKQNLIDPLVLSVFLLVVMFFACVVGRHHLRRFVAAPEPFCVFEVRWPFLRAYTEEYSAVGLLHNVGLGSGQTAVHLTLGPCDRRGDLSCYTGEKIPVSGQMQEKPKV